MNIRKLLSQLKAHPESTTIDFSGFRPTPKFIRHLNNESARDMRIIARRIKIVHEKGNHEEDVKILCSKFNLVFLSRINDLNYVFIRKDSLTKYESENGVITISAYKGDSWFKDIDSKFSNDNIPTISELSQFYISLNEERKSEIDPIKLRTLDYSIHMLKQRYILDYFETELNEIFVLNSKVLIINKNTGEKTEFEIRPLRGLLSRIFKVYQKLGVVFYATTIVLIATYSLQSIQIDVIAPFINFNQYSHEIGDAIDWGFPITSIDDNMDPEQFIRFEILNSPIITEPGIVKVDYLVVDRSNNSREQSTTINVVDTTRPVLTPTNISNVIEFDDYRRFNYLRYVEASDNHRIDSLTYRLPYDVSPEAKPLGNYRITFNAKDPSGNQSSIDRTITIVDTVRPTFDLGSQRITVNFNDRNTFDYTKNAVNVFDNYDSSRVRLEYTTTYDYVNPGTHPFTISAIDVSGNRTSKNFTVSIVDTTPPFVRVVTDTTINVNNIGSFNPQALILETRDNHRVASISQSPLSVLSNRIGVVNFDTIVTDASGNRTVATTRVNIVDTTRPIVIILRPSSTYTNRIPSDLEIFAMVRASDNFDPSPRLTWSGSLLNSRNGTTNTIFITATDRSGNQTTVQVRITLINTSAVR